MESLDAAVRVVIGLFILVTLFVLIRLALRATDGYETQYSVNYRRSVELNGADFDDRYDKCMSEFVRLGNRLSCPLRDDFYNLASDIMARTTELNYNMLRLLSDDQKMVTSYRATWRQYEKDINRLIGLKSR